MFLRRFKESGNQKSFLPINKLIGIKEFIEGRIKTNLSRLIGSGHRFCRFGIILLIGPESETMLPGGNLDGHNVVALLHGDIDDKLRGNWSPVRLIDVEDEFAINP